MRGNNRWDDIVIRLDNLTDRVLAGEPDEEKSMNDDPFPICPLPALGYCVRERCNFWDDDHEECTAACFDDPGSRPDPDAPCLIMFCEDYD